MSSIRNKDGIWINTSVFTEEAEHFRKYGYYCPDPHGSPAWTDYWEEQTRRIIFGYESGGARITGDHYFYLNFCPILKTNDVSKNKKRAKKEIDFPDFWDGDYEFFWSRAIARDGVIELLMEDTTVYDTLNPEQQQKRKELLLDSLHMHNKISKDSLDGGFNMIIGKSRRKGYSYKNSAIGVKNYITVPESLTIYGAYEKKFLYPKGTFTMCKNYINFLNDNTAWAMPSDYIDRTDHIKASYTEYKNGIELEKGFRSEIMALTFKDNPDAARGKDAVDIFFEEAGAFGTPGLLLDSYAASEDCVKDGDIKTGMITIFGTSGDVSGGTADYAHMYFHPEKYGLLPFEDIWEEGDTYEKRVGFFHPVHLNMNGFIDEQGNSDLEGAKKSVIESREYLISKGANTADMQRKSQEKPLTPSEAFSYTNINVFPRKELEARKLYLIAKGYDKLKAQPVNLYRDPDTHRVVSHPDLTGKLQPITSMNYEGISIEGAPVIYEYPIPNAPRGLYKIGYDPVRQDIGTSLAAIIVYKGVMQGEYTKNCIVAEYIGRKPNPDDNHLIAELFAELYNTQIMYENEVPDVKTYFTRRKLLHLLALQPDTVINKSIKKSTVARVYGSHMTPQLKDAGERYINSWLKEVQDFDENNQPITTIDRINSLRLIEELLLYNKKGNFDLISALIMCMFQVQEEILGKEYSEKTTNRSSDKLLSMMRSMYKNSAVY
jgi:hypothetical protein